MFYPKIQSTTTTLALTLALSSVSCGKKGFQTKGGAEQKLAISCIESNDNRFVWDWCGSNIVSGSDVREVCVGKYHHTDMIFSAILLKTKQNPSGECFADLGESQAGTPEVGCQTVVNRKYGYVAGSTKNMDVLECLNNTTIDRVGGSIPRYRGEFLSARPQ